MTAYLLLSPYLGVLVVFTFFSIIYAFYLSFHSYDLLSAPIHVGLRNYRTLLWDPDFRMAIKNTCIYTVWVVGLQTALALLIAVILDQKLKGKPFFRAAFYFPSVTCSVVISLIFMWMFSKLGMINYVLSLVKEAPLLGWVPDDLDWLRDKRFALQSIMSLNIWTTSGTFMVIFLAGLQSIPETVYEAARIDGAHPFRVFWKITLPLLRPTIFFVVVMGMIGCFQVFDQIYVMTNGGPLKSTLTVVYLIYSYAFRDFSMGYACAGAFLLFAVIFTATSLARKFLDVEPEY